MGMAQAGALLGTWPRQGLNLGLAGDTVRPRQGNTLYQQCRQGQDGGHCQTGHNHGNSRVLTWDGGEGSALGVVTADWGGAWS